MDEKGKKYAVTTTGLTRRFGSLTAVDCIDLSIARGEVFGLLGPNGAGKTTTISMLATLLKPTSGRAYVGGYDVTAQKVAVRSSIGLVFQDPSSDEELTAEENMNFHGRLYSVPRSIRKKRIPELLSMVDLTDRSGDRVKTFSGGMKRRLEIARGFLHHPSVLFLDEPTTGLDPQTRRRIWEHIQALNSKREVTVLLTTHSMEEADFLCGRIAIMDHGKIIALDSPEELKNGLGGDLISIQAENTDELLGLLQGADWADPPWVHNEYVNITVKEGESKIPVLLRLAERSGIKIKSVTLKKPTLEDVFIHHTGRTIRPEAGSTVDRMRQRRRAFG
ncbi:MAG: ATP-binding cassette domain-containing protein, partial [bacterium]